MTLKVIKGHFFPRMLQKERYSLSQLAIDSKYR